MITKAPEETECSFEKNKVNIVPSSMQISARHEAVHQTLKLSNRLSV